MRATGLLVMALLAAAATATVTAQDVPAADAAPCGPDTVRLVSFHYLVDGIRHDRLDGNVGTGDAFTLVVGLQACGSPVQAVAMDLMMPPCQTPREGQRLQGLEDLNSAHVTDDAEPAMVADLRAALSCDAVLPQGFASAAIASLTLGAIGTLVAIFAIRRFER